MSLPCRPTSRAQGASAKGLPEGINTWYQEQYFRIRFEAIAAAHSQKPPIEKALTWFSGLTREQCGLYRPGGRKSADAAGDSAFFNPIPAIMRPFRPGGVRAPPANRFRIRMGESRSGYRIIYVS